MSMVALAHALLYSACHSAILFALSRLDSTTVVHDIAHLTLLPYVCATFDHATSHVALFCDTVSFDCTKLSLLFSRHLLSCQCMLHANHIARICSDHIEKDSVVQRLLSCRLRFSFSDSCILPYLYRDTSMMQLFMGLLGSYIFRTSAAASSKYPDGGSFEGPWSTEASEVYRRHAALPRVGRGQQLSYLQDSPSLRRQRISKGRHRQNQDPSEAP